MRRGFTVLTLSFALLASLAQAEYRVFRLKITKTPKEPVPAEGQAATPPPPPEDRFVESTLDPEQYRGYNPVAADETVTYVDTWRCRGRTDDFKPYCPSPRGPASDRAPIPSTPVQGPVSP